MAQAPIHPANDAPQIWAGPTLGACANFVLVFFLCWADFPAVPLLRCDNLLERLYPEEKICWSAGVPERWSHHIAAVSTFSSHGNRLRALPRSALQNPYQLRKWERGRVGRPEHKEVHLLTVLFKSAKLFSSVRLHRLVATNAFRIGQASLCTGSASCTRGSFVTLPW